MTLGALTASQWVCAKIYKNTPGGLVVKALHESPTGVFPTCVLVVRISHKQPTARRSLKLGSSEDWCQRGWSGERTASLSYFETLGEGWKGLRSGTLAGWSWH